MPRKQQTSCARNFGTIGQLYRSWRGKRASALAIADDYVFLIQGLLELHQADPDSDWLNWAVELQEQLDDTLWSDEWQGYVMRPKLEGRVLVTQRNDYDGAEPSPNHVGILQPPAAC